MTICRKCNSQITVNEPLILAVIRGRKSVTGLNKVVFYWHLGSCFDRHELVVLNKAVADQLRLAGDGEKKKKRAWQHRRSKPCEKCGHKISMQEPAVIVFVPGLEKFWYVSAEFWHGSCFDAGQAEIAREDLEQIMEARRFASRSGKEIVMQFTREVL